LRTAVLADTRTGLTSSPTILLDTTETPCSFQTQLRQPGREL
jgi:hypothetical protein